MSEARRTLAEEGIYLDRAPLPSNIAHNGLDPSLSDILIDITSVCKLLNHDLHGRTLDLITFQNIQMSICYRLLQFRPLNEYTAMAASGPPNAEEIYSIGLTVFMMTIFLQYNNRRIVDFKRAFECLKTVASVEFSDGESDLGLWLLLIGGIWLTGEQRVDWLAPAIHRVAQRLGLADWDAVFQCVAKFPWIHVLHDEPGRAVWSQISPESRK